MILGKLQLNEAQTISFGINVFGTTQQPSAIRFIIEDDKFDIICKCKQVGEDLEVEIPPMKGILESKEYPVRLEVIIGDKIFTPLKESIEFNPLVEFGVQKKRIEIKNEGIEIKVNASSSEVKKSSLQEKIDSVSDRYEVKDINGFNVMMKNGYYFGLVSESKVIESDVGFETFTELVDYLSKSISK